MNSLKVTNTTRIRTSLPAALGAPPLSLTEALLRSHESEKRLTKKIRDLNAEIGARKLLWAGYYLGNLLCWFVFARKFDKTCLECKQFFNN